MNARVASLVLPLAALSCAGGVRATDPTPAPASEAAVAAPVVVGLHVPDAAPAPAPTAPSPIDDASVRDAPDETLRFAGETLTALAYQVPLFFEARMDPDWSGYLRAGGTARVLRGPLGNAGCMARDDRTDTGWYEVEGGYVCVSRGAILTRHLTRELRARLPVAPRRDAGMPYRYAEAPAEAVVYRALPSLIDEQSTEPERFRAPEDLAAERAMESSLGAAPPAPRMLEDLAGLDGTPVLRRLTRAMVVSLDRATRAESGALFWRTQRGGYARVDALGGVGGPTFRGVHLDARTRLPIAFVTVADGASFRPNTRGAMVRGGRLPRLSAVPLGDGASMTVRGEEYLATRAGAYVMRRQVSVVAAHAPPEALPPGERWIDVNLDRQSLVAYEGATPVLATVVSTGIPGRAEGSADYETVQGGFRIRHKHLSTTMDGNSATGAYSIEDVPWVMYFEESFALHGAFWHSGFGRVRSHGCVNLSPDDARWLFEWTEPHLPPGWHGVFSAADDPGTRVYVHHESQALGERGGPSIVPQH